MKGERQRRVLHGGVFHSEVAGGAAVHALQTGEQDLPDDQRRGQHGVLRGGVRFRLRFQAVVTAPDTFFQEGVPACQTATSMSASTTRLSAKNNCGILRFHYSAPVM